VPIRPTRTLKTILTAVALTGLLVVLVPIWAVHRLVSGLLVRRPAGSRTPIERVAAADVDLDEVIAGGRPVVISGLAERLGLPLVPDLEGLRKLAQSNSTTFKVRSHSAHAPYFLYVGDYGAELVGTDEMNLATFLDSMFGDASSGTASFSTDTCTYRLFGVNDLEGDIGRIIDTMSEGLATLTDRRPDRSASGIWIGASGAVTPLHHDAWTGLLFQMTGSKRVLMFPPTERPNLYFTSPFAAKDRWSTLPGRSGDADPAAFPRFARARGFEAQLDAGDVLFIPAFWSHEIEALEANISIPFRFGTRTIDQLNPGFLRPAYEVFHRKYVEPARSHAVPARSGS
jgi:hypothetical protein